MELPGQEDAKMDHKEVKMQNKPGQSRILPDESSPQVPPCGPPPSIMSFLVAQSKAEDADKVPAAVL